MHKIQDTQTGTMIDTYATYGEAKAALEAFEASDKAEGIYEEGFYEIRPQDMDAAAALMDDEIREAIHAEIGGICTDTEFLAEYCRRHLAKYGEEFAI